MSVYERKPGTISYSKTEEARCANLPVAEGPHEANGKMRGGYITPPTLASHDAPYLVCLLHESQ